MCAIPQPESTGMLLHYSLYMTSTLFDVDYKFATNTHCSIPQPKSLGNEVQVFNPTVYLFGFDYNPLCKNTYTPYLQTTSARVGLPVFSKMTVVCMFVRIRLRAGQEISNVNGKAKWFRCSKYFRTLCRRFEHFFVCKSCCYFA